MTGSRTLSRFTWAVLTVSRRACTSLALVWWSNSATVPGADPGVELSGREHRRRAGQVVALGVGGRGADQRLGCGVRLAGVASYGGQVLPRGGVLLRVDVLDSPGECRIGLLDVGGDGVGGGRRRRRGGRGRAGACAHGHGQHQAEGSSGRHEVGHRTVGAVSKSQHESSLSVGRRLPSFQGRPRRPENRRGQRPTVGGACWRRALPATCNARRTRRGRNLSHEFQRSDRRRQRAVSRRCPLTPVARGGPGAGGRLGDRGGAGTDGAPAAGRGSGRRQPGTGERLRARTPAGG